MVPDKICRLVNENPRLLSALYDMNLLPEQVVTKDQLGALTYFSAGYALALEELQAKEAE